MTPPQTTHVMFVFSGLPHYYNAILNRLNQTPSLQVSVVVPNQRANPEPHSKNIGSGVYQSKKGIDFKVFELNEYKTYYQKTFFRGFIKHIKTHKPDILVMGWPHILAFFFNPLLFFWVKRLNIKVIIKEIPYQIPKKNEAIAFYKNTTLLKENGQPGAKHSVLYYRFLTFVRSFYYTKVIDASVNYVEDAVEILGSYGLAKQKIFVTYNSPDTDVLLRANETIKHREPILEPNPSRIIHVGRLIAWKRVDMLIECVRNLKNEFPKIELLVVGEGVELNQLKSQVADYKLDTHIKFIGAVYDIEQLGQYFQASSFYVLAGVGGLSINDAMCFERAIVCSECDGTEKALVKEGENGLFFEAGNQMDLQKKIRILLQNPVLSRQMGKNSHQIIKTKINIHTVINIYKKAFDYVVNK